MPGAPASDLVLIKSNQAFGCLEGFLDAPALSGHGNQGAQRDGRGAVAAQVGVLARGVVAPDQQMVDAGVGVVFGQQAKPGPGVQAWSVCPRPAECFCQAWAGISAGRASTRIGPAWVGTRRLAAMAITTPDRGRGSPPAGAGRRHRLHLRRPMRRGHSR